MNRRFLRWILDRAHAMEAFEKRQYKFISFEKRETTLRWNSLMCAAGFAFLPLLGLQSQDIPGLLIAIGMAGLDLSLWVFWYHLHVMHHMRRKGKRRESRRVMRRMLNAVPMVIGFFDFVFAFGGRPDAVFFGVSCRIRPNAISRFHNGNDCHYPDPVFMPAFRHALLDQRRPHAALLSTQ